MTPTSEYRELLLSGGRYSALIDTTDFDWLAQWKWHVIWDRNVGGFYAIRRVKEPSGKRSSIRMHRQIMGLGGKNGIEVDHIKPRYSRQPQG